MPNSTVFSGVKVTLFGHSSVMLEADGLTFYIDPFILPQGARPADAIFYTHGHHDHCAPAPKITSNSTVLVGSGSCRLPVRVIEIGSSEMVGGVGVEAVDAYNIGKPFHPKGAGAGYIFHFKTARVYVAGDTDVIPEMKRFKCDIAILPIGGTFTMDASEAADALAAIMPKVAIPYHYNYLSDTNVNPAEFREMAWQKTGGKVDVRILLP